MSFPSWMKERAARSGSRVVVGLDPDIDKFPAALKKRLADNARDEVAATIYEFNEAIIDATEDLVVAYKPQIAFYEQYGQAGMMALERTIGCLRTRHLPAILDAKRNDVENTAAAYAKAWLAESTPLGLPNAQRVDAITLNPYMGADSIRPFLSVSQTAGVFILAKTSNPGAFLIQDVQAPSGQKISEIVAEMASSLGAEEAGPGEYSRVGLVVGATYPEDARRLRKIAPNALFLMPGVGAQGGSLSAIAAASDKSGFGAFASTSRAVTYGFDEPSNGERWVDTVRQHSASAVRALREKLNKEIRI